MLGYRLPSALLRQRRGLEVVGRSDHESRDLLNETGVLSTDVAWPLRWGLSKRSRRVRRLPRQSRL